MALKKKVFSEKKFKTFPIYLILLIIISLYVGYIFVFHKPDIKFDSTKTVSLSGIQTRVLPKDSQIKDIELKFISENNTEFLLDNKEINLDDGIIDINYSFLNNEKITKFFKKNNNKNIYLNFKISYENIFFNRILEKKIKLLVDVLPPKIFDVTTDGYVYLGGIGYVKYKTSNDASKTYIDNGNGNIFYPISSVKDNFTEHLVFFSCSNKPCKNQKIEIIAEDLSLNKSKVSKKIKTIKNKRWKEINILLSRDMMHDKYEEIFNEEIEIFSKENFIKLNKDERLRNETYINSITSKITNKRLFDGKFHQLKNSKVSSEFSELRTYLFNDDAENIVDKQYHWGIDLSSLKNAKVYAANKGTVVLVEESLGIYGGVVIIDHGLGFYSLYSHLENIQVKISQSVTLSTIVGNTGTTGFAFGDHLHFGIFLQGVAVDPVEFLDENYLNIKIYNPHDEFINLGQKN